MLFDVFLRRAAGFTVRISVRIYRPAAPNYMFTHIIVAVPTEIFVTTGASAYAGPDMFFPQVQVYEYII